MTVSSEAPAKEIQVATETGPSIFQINLDRNLLSGSPQRNPTRTMVSEALASDHQEFVMDFSKVTFMDAYRLGIVLAVVRDIQKSGGRVSAEGMREDVITIFYDTKLFVIFDKF